jgi:hypothetical protein
MHDSITREELIREVGERLDADPELVTRRIAAAGRGGGRRPAPAAAEAGEAPAPVAPARPLSSRERREQALLAMCVAAPPEGRDFLDRLADEHFSSEVAARARRWLREHLDEPTRGISHDDEPLLAYVTRVTMLAEREPATPEAMELSFLELELARVDDQIQAAEGNGGEPPVDLQRHRAELSDRIARAHS